MRRVTTLLLAIMTVLAACTNEAPSLAEVASSGDAPPADAVLVDADWPEVAAWIGERNAEGRPVVVNFFASWCPPCVRELPLLIETAERERDVVFLGINHVDQRPLAEAMVAEHGIAYPTLRDSGGDVVAEMGGRGLPHTVVFDTDGRLVGSVAGELSAATLGGLLDRVR